MVAFFPANPVVYGLFFPGSRTVYVGSAGDHLARWAKHVRQLRAGVHHCEKLQAAFDGEGEAAVMWRVLEQVRPGPGLAERLEAAEARWIAYYVGELGRPRVLNRSRKTRQRGGWRGRPEAAQQQSSSPSRHSEREGEERRTGDGVGPGHSCGVAAKIRDREPPGGLS